MRKNALENFAKGESKESLVVGTNEDPLGWKSGSPKGGKEG